MKTKTHDQSNVVLTGQNQRPVTANCIEVEDYVTSPAFSGVVLEISHRGYGLKICFDGIHETFIAREQVTSINGRAVL